MLRGDNVALDFSRCKSRLYKKSYARETVNSDVMNEIVKVKMEYADKAKSLDDDFNIIKQVYEEEIKKAKHMQDELQKLKIEEENNIRNRLMKELEEKEAKLVRLNSNVIETDIVVDKQKKKTLKPKPKLEIKKWK